jgi:hypothetical protein
MSVCRKAEDMKIEGAAHELYTQEALGATSDTLQLNLLQNLEYTYVGPATMRGADNANCG